MSSPNVFESPTFDQPRPVYRPAVVDLFRRTTDPVIQQATKDISEWQAEADLLAAKIADAHKYIDEIRHAVRGIEERADLPAVSLLPQVAEAQRHAETFGGPQTGVLMYPLCGCGQPMVEDEKRGLIHPVEGGWEAAGDACKRVKDASTPLPPTGDGVS